MKFDDVLASFLSASDAGKEAEVSNNIKQTIEDEDEDGVTIIKCVDAVHDDDDDDDDVILVCGVQVVHQHCVLLL